MKLYDLLSECINTTYHQTGCAASYALRRERNTLYIFFQHSNGEIDWKRNLSFPVCPYQRMGQSSWYVHRGFLSAWRDIEPIIAEAIGDGGVRKAVITGYSHGAAIGVLCHEYIWYNRPDLRNFTEGYGFGCPRVIWGSPDAELLRRWERFTVIRNIDDIVTHLPPAFLGYTHVGKLLVIGERGKYSRVEAHYAANMLTELLAYESAGSSADFGGFHIKFGDAGASVPR